MPEPSPRRADREAQRSLIVDALGDLPAADDPHAAASELMRAIDAYIESAPGPQSAPREAATSDYERREMREARSITWIVIACAALASIVVSVLLSGGWFAGLAVGAIWVLAVLALMSA